MCERVGDPTEHLSQAIDALAALDPDRLPDGKLHNVVCALEREESRFAAARARLIAAWDARRVWADDGSKAANGRLARERDLSPETSRAELRRARKLRSMPATATALADGKLSADKADLLAQVNQPELASLFARDEQMLVGEIGSLSHTDARRALQYWLQLADDEADRKPASCRHERRWFRAVRTFRRNLDLRGNFDPLGGTEFFEEWQRLCHELYEADWAEARAEHGEDVKAEHLRRTAGQRGADALQLMARRSASTHAAARLPRPLLTVLVGYGTFSKICELADGTVLAPGEIVPLLADADIERIVFDGPSRVIDVGAKRFFSGALRRAVEVRDRHCQHPSGCDVPANRCDVDHILPTSEGGLTCQENGRCLCGFHNRQRPGAQRKRPPPEPHPRN